MNGIFTTDDNIIKVVGDNNAADGVDEATKKITSSVDNAPLPSSRSMTAVDDNTSRRKQHHHHTRRKNQQQQQQMQQKGVALSGGSTADNDTSYCTEIARRAVARGALHLGFEGMEGEALDVLGNVLLGYMEMVRPFFFVYLLCAKLNNFCCCIVWMREHSSEDILFFHNCLYRSVQQYRRMSNYLVDLRHM
jgi:hypothetical protein